MSPFIIFVIVCIVYRFYLSLWCDFVIFATTSFIFFRLHPNLKRNFVTTRIILIYVRICVYFFFSSVTLLRSVGTLACQMLAFMNCLETWHLGWASCEALEWIESRLGWPTPGWSGFGEFPHWSFAEAIVMKLSWILSWERIVSRVSVVRAQFKDAWGFVLPLSILWSSDCAPAKSSIPCDCVCIMISDDKLQLSLNW